MWFSFNLSSPLHWYTVHIVFVFNFCFSSLLVLLVEMKEKKRKEKKTCAGNSVNRMQVKNQSDNDHVRYLSSFFVATIYGRSRKRNEQSFIFMKNSISASIKCNCTERFFI